MKPHPALVYGRVFARAGYGSMPCIRGSTHKRWAQARKRWAQAEGTERCPG